eukprot:554995_1
MSVFDWIFITAIFYVSFKTYNCCPSGFTHCATENTDCTLAELPETTNIIAFGKDGHRFAYKDMTGAFTCSTSFGDPVSGIAKECCYQTNKITNIPTFTNPSLSISWAASTISCNQQINSWVYTSSTNNIYKFVNTEIQDVYFSNCGSDVSDTKLYLYDSTGNSIMSETKSPGCCGLIFCNSCGSCDGNDCGSDYCSQSKRETFDYYDLPVGTYYILFTPNSGSGNYQLTVECPSQVGPSGYYQFEYTQNVVTCQQNILHSATSTANRIQYFQVTTKSKWDITFKNCDTAYDSNLYIYKDSLYQDKVTGIGGDNDDCASGYQEIYTKSGLEPGNYYIKMGTASGCPTTACYGSNKFSIDCVNPGTYPTAQPSPAPTDPSSLPTFAPTTPTDSPSAAPTFNPTASPTAPTSSPTQSSQPPTITPSYSPSNSPSRSPTQPPTFSPSFAPTPLTTSPTASPSHAPTNPTTDPTIAPSISPSQPPTMSPTMAPTIAPDHSQLNWRPIFKINKGRADYGLQSNPNTYYTSGTTTYTTLALEDAYALNIPTSIENNNFRSLLINMWKTNSIQVVKVRIDFYGLENKYVEFDATNVAGN